MAIIKMKSRKQKYSAKQLVRYILSDGGRIEHTFSAPIVLQNINRLDLETLHKDFTDNTQYLPKRKNGVLYYHEIIAISKKDKEHVTPEILQDLMKTYIKMRGFENAIVLAKSHDNQHIHVMSSANELRSAKRLRMDYGRMQKLLVNFEEWHKSKYPQLENSLVHTIKEKSLKRNFINEDKNKRREREFSMKMRMGSKKTQKELASEMVESLMQKVGNFSQLEAFIKQTDGLDIYSYRGKIKGIMFENRKYRFSTLNVSKERINQLEKHQSRLDELRLIKEMHKGTRERTLSR